DHEKFVLAIAQVMAQEAFELEAAGARYLQIDEPALLGAPEDHALAGRAIESITSALESSETETTLATYFGDAKRLGPELFELPVDYFGFDFVSGPENLEVIKAIPDGAGVQAGVVDARNTRLEDTDGLVATIGGLAEALGSDRLRVSPSAGLEFLPREKARAKLAHLSEAAKKAGA
ncbi:MAG: hypothetical protein ACRDJ2_14105, partial [Actinomycetota bacterium]